MIVPRRNLPRKLDPRQGIKAGRIEDEIISPIFPLEERWLRSARSKNREHHEIHQHDPLQGRSN